MNKFDFSKFTLNKEDKLKLSKSIAFYAKSGIEISTENELYGNKIIVSVKQLNIDDGVLLNRKELHSRALAALAPYIDKNEFVIHQKVFTPNISDINIEWIEKRMKRYDISRHDLEKQLCIDKHVLSKIFNDARGMTRSMKAAIFYYLLVYEMNQSRKKETDMVISQSAEIIKRLKK